MGLLFSQPCEHRREDVGKHALRTPPYPETRVIVIIVVIIPLASLYFALCAFFCNFRDRQRSTQRYPKWSKWTVPTTLAVVGLLFSQPCEHRREDVGKRALRTPPYPETRVVVIIVVVSLLSLILP